MYLNIGNGVLVRKERVIAVFSLETMTGGRGSRNFLQKMQKSGRVINVSGDIPRSVVLTDNDDMSEAQIYLSPVASYTYKDRE